mmetsp:Transcript_67300/g.132747  ORF Transcript_67300/g.132747 Transcript_67300/m.132747 type:complete len:274 (-) Transcript_67300:1049-1870(-)
MHKWQVSCLCLCRHKKNDLTNSMQPLLVFSCQPSPSLGPGGRRSTPCSRYLIQNASTGGSHKTHDVASKHGRHHQLGENGFAAWAQCREDSQLHTNGPDVREAAKSIGGNELGPFRELAFNDLSLPLIVPKKLTQAFVGHEFVYSDLGANEPRHMCTVLGWGAQQPRQGPEDIRANQFKGQLRHANICSQGVQQSICRGLQRDECNKQRTNIQHEFHGRDGAVACSLYNVGFGRRRELKVVVAWRALAGLLNFFFAQAAGWADQIRHKERAGH